jgi:hypothetical protein
LGTLRLRNSAPPLAAFTPDERRPIARLRTPDLVQRFFNRLPYNTEPPPHGGSLRSFRQVLRHGEAHCLEAALAAACILEQHGYPPLVISFESIDGLDHVIFVYRTRGRWGSVARSRDPGLHGRKPVFRSLRALAMSYFDPYVDATGCLEGYGLVDLRGLGKYDWRFAPKNMWAIERFLIQAQHIGRSRSRANASGACALVIWHIGQSTAKSRCSIAAGKSGRRYQGSFRTLPGANAPSAARL